MINRITILSHPVYGKTYYCRETNLYNHTSTEVYREGLEPQIVKAIIENREPIVRDLRDSYTITVYEI